MNTYYLKYTIWGHVSSGSGEGNGTPLQCSCLENPRDGGAWWAAVYGVAQSQTRLKRLSSSSSSSNSGSVVKTPCFHCRGHRFNPWSGNWDSACFMVWHKIKYKIIILWPLNWVVDQLRDCAYRFAKYNLTWRNSEVPLNKHFSDSCVPLYAECNASLFDFSTH